MFFFAVDVTHWLHFQQLIRISYILAVKSIRIDCSSRKVHWFDIIGFVSYMIAFHDMETLDSYFTVARAFQRRRGSRDRVSEQNRVNGASGKDG